jgi:transposase-like protein
LDDRFLDVAKRPYSGKYSLETKEKAVYLSNNTPYSFRKIAEMLGVENPVSIARWTKNYNKRGEVALMSTSDLKISGILNPSKDEDLSDKNSAELIQIIKKLQAENDTLKKANELAYNLNKEYNK